MFLPTLNRIGQKMKKQHLFEYWLFSAIFDTQRSKDDVIGIIVTSVWIWLNCFWEILCHITIMPSLVVIGQQIWFQNTPAWIGLKGNKSFRVIWWRRNLVRLIIILIVRDNIWKRICLKYPKTDILDHVTNFFRFRDISCETIHNIHFWVFLDYLVISTRPACVKVHSPTHGMQDRVRGKMEAETELKIIHPYQQQISIN